MNAARIITGAALALAFGAVQAQDTATTSPLREPKATATQEQKAATAMPADQGTAPARDTGKSRQFAKSELSSSVARLTKFEDFDKNKDGSIAKEEVPANDDLALRFQSYDKDSDSKISQQEFALYKNGGNRQVASAKQSKPKAKAESKPEQQ